jgi:hypothetical protein
MPRAHRIRLHDGAPSELEEGAAGYLEVRHGGNQEHGRFLLWFAGRSSYPDRAGDGATGLRPPPYIRKRR